ncbi:YaeQ family protein [Teredinibacter purpureus]|uniref:YaeQ family protein n=1 Tax=Teredinibacter purpureus TaxID=2731756 RepID=UPI0005F790F0|nr:YaeQ family protein [Teredinibacter purpureus]
MALSATIYKFTIALSDLNRHYYDSVALTVAQHPSENAERMMARVLAFCLHAQEFLEFTKGLSTPETPDIWAKSLDGNTTLWVEVGEPSADKLKKATRIADEVWVYTFNSKSEVWWQQEQVKINPLALKVRRLVWAEVETFAGMLSRKMDLSMTISGDSAFIATDKGECEVHWQDLKDA